MEFVICHKDMSNEEVIMHADWKQHAYKAKEMIGGKVRYIYDNAKKIGGQLYNKANQIGDKVSYEATRRAGAYSLNAYNRNHGISQRYKYSDFGPNSTYKPMYNINSTRKNLEVAAKSTAYGVGQDAQRLGRAGVKLAKKGLSAAKEGIKSAASKLKKKISDYRDDRAIKKTIKSLSKGYDKYASNWAKANINNPDQKIARNARNYSPNSITSKAVKGAISGVANAWNDFNKKYKDASRGSGNYR